MALLVTLLVIGYATRFSEYFQARDDHVGRVTPAFIVAVTLALHEIMRRYLLSPSNARKTVMAGCTEASVDLAERLSRCSEFGMEVVGFFDDRGKERLNVKGQVQSLGKLGDLAAYIREHNVEVIFIALPVRQVARVMALVEELRDTTASIYYLPDIPFFDLIQARSIVIEGIPAISMCETPFFGHRAIAKRFTDVLISATVLILAAPLMLAIAILVRLSSPGPVIFRQRRYGLNGEEIIVYKFRTMTVTEDGATSCRRPRRCRVSPRRTVLTALFAR